MEPKWGPKGCPEMFSNRLGQPLGMTMGVPGLPRGAVGVAGGVPGGFWGSALGALWLHFGLRDRPRRHDDDNDDDDDDDDVNKLIQGSPGWGKGAVEIPRGSASEFQLN